MRPRAAQTEHAAGLNYCASCARRLSARLNVDRATCEVAMVAAASRAEAAAAKAALAASEPAWPTSVAVLAPAARKPALRAAVDGAPRGRAPESSWFEVSALRGPQSVAVSRRTQAPRILPHAALMRGPPPMRSVPPRVDHRRVSLALTRRDEALPRRGLLPIRAPPLLALSRQGSAVVPTDHAPLVIPPSSLDGMASRPDFTDDLFDDDLFDDVSEECAGADADDFVIPARRAPMEYPSDQAYGAPAAQRSPLLGASPRAASADGALPLDEKARARYYV